MIEIPGKNSPQDGWTAHQAKREAYLDVRAEGFMQDDLRELLSKDKARSFDQTVAMWDLDEVLQDKSREIAKKSTEDPRYRRAYEIFSNKRAAAEEKRNS